MINLMLLILRSLPHRVVDALIKCSEGDLRKAITFLQSAARLVGAIEKEDDGDKMDVDDDAKVVTVKIIEEIAGVIPDQTIERLQKAIQPKSGGATYPAVAKIVEDMVADGWSAGQVLSQVSFLLRFLNLIVNPKFF